MSELKLNQQKLLDKLGERWLFEKKSVTLYDLVIKKLEECEFNGDIERLRHNRSEELDHQRLLEEYIKACGSNTRKKTPSQMLVEQESRAFENIVADTQDPAHLLHVLLDAEMEDNASWELLIQLARKAGQQDFISKFERAIGNERQHLRAVRTMVTRLARQELFEHAGA